MTLHSLPSARAALALPQPYLLFLGDLAEPGFAKTAFGLRDWAPELCLGEHACPGATLSLGLPRLSPADAAARGARAMVIGVANVGGVISEAWEPELLAALDAGLDLIGGLHARLADQPVLAARAQALGRRLIDVRRPPADLPIGTGRRRSGRRLLTVGTDCALGKKYTALALTEAFRTRGLAATFRATGQTGILIAGAGVPLDAVVADFAAGAAETLSPDAPADHWDVIEGQGSLLHPAYAAVSLGLLHGSQPDVFVVCHEPGRRTMMGLPDYPTPKVAEIVDLTTRLGRLTNPGIRCAGVSLNTHALSETEAQRTIASYAEVLGLPAADPVRGGPSLDALVNACLA